VVFDQHATVSFASSVPVFLPQLRSTITYAVVGAAGASRFLHKRDEIEFIDGEINRAK